MSHHHSHPAITVGLLIIAILIMLFTGEARAQDINRERASAVIERRLKRLERLDTEFSTLVPDFKKEIEMVMEKYAEKMRVAGIGIKEMIAGTKDDLCNMGASNFCPVPEPEPEVSAGHTMKVSFDVKVTFANPEKRQTDESPCEGAGGNICDAMEKGLNPVAVSRELWGYPLNKGAIITLTPKGDRAECAFLKDMEFTAMDTLSDCTRANRDLRTGRCLQLIENQVDVYLPCVDEACLIGRAKANSIGSCMAVLTKK